MMKIKSLDTENIYILPLESQITIIDTNHYKEDLIKCFQSLASGKRKTNCILLNEFNEIIPKFDCQFIYVSNDEIVDSNFQLKTKSTFNTELSTLIQNNPENFTSIEKMRDGCNGLLTDKGIYQFIRILNRGIHKSIQFKMEDFNISSILQMLEIEVGECSRKEKFMMIYNLLIYLNKNQTNIVYIDFPIDNDVLKWISSIKDPNLYFLLENEAIEGIDQFDETVNFIRLSNCDYKEEFEVKKNEIARISYIFHSFVLKNMGQQSQKNIDLYHVFCDKKTTYFIKSSDTYVQETL